MSIKALNLDIGNKSITFDMFLSSYSEDSDFEFPIKFNIELEVCIDADEGLEYGHDDIHFTRVVMIFGEDERIILPGDHTIVQGLEDNDALKQHIFDSTTLQINNYKQDRLEDEGDYLYERWKDDRADEKLGRD